MTSQEKKRYGKKLNGFEHCLLRPDTYVGSVTTETREMWVAASPGEEDEGDEVDVDDEGNEYVVKKSKPAEIVKRSIQYNAGLTRIFVEILSNAVDNKWRSSEHDVPMRKIEFVIEDDPDSEHYGWITVTNDGVAIPVHKHAYKTRDARTGQTAKEELYPAEMFFGDFLSGTNYEDDENRKTSGRNGMGAKATNALSLEFLVDHADPETKKRFVQKYQNHGKVRSEPKVTTFKGKMGYTTIAFLPDYEFFGYPGVDEDLMALLKRYIIEAAMITGLAITLNGEKIVVKDLTKYARLYFPNPKENQLVTFKTEMGDECVVVEGDIPVMNQLEEVPHMSYVNGIHTRDGGVHVTAWSKAIMGPLMKKFNQRKPKKGEKTVLKTSQKELYPYFVLFVRCELHGAKFDSQTKDRLNSPTPDLWKPEDRKGQAAFKAQIDTAVTKMLKWNFVALLEDKLAMQSHAKDSRSEGKSGVRASIKYTPANWAGGKFRHLCAVWASEGLSAKSMADRLISQMKDGTNANASYALKGKFLNVQNTSHRLVLKNKEVIELKDILGLRFGMDYSDDKNRGTLKYGKGVCILVDADDDGIHIAGLLMNFFYKYWPSLCNPKFLRMFSTVVTVASHGKGSKLTQILFYSNPEYRKWQASGEPAKFKKGQLRVKYYKGLGSHGPGEEKLYTDPKYVRLCLDGKEPRMMDLGFNKEKSNARKEWITRDMIAPGTLALEEAAEKEYTVEGKLSLSKFVDSHLIIYHRMALRRALPNLLDGLKEGQRKALFGIMQDKDARHRTVGVENLTGSIKKATGYHHGAMSLEGTIKHMARGYAGSNNIPLLKNDGNFGYRKQCGKDAASARYIATGLEEIATKLFSPLDEPVLEINIEDNEPVEYRQFVPILPPVLINGATGIASGWSTNIPAYNPTDLVDWVEAWLISKDGEVHLPPLTPWYRGFTGEIELVESSEGSGEYTAWLCKGVLNPHPKKKGVWVLSEVPLNMSFIKMGEYLEYLKTGTPIGKYKTKAQKFLKSYAWSGTVNTPYWEITPNKNFIPDMEVAGNFKCLQERHSLANMVVIDENDYPRRYATPEDLLKDFCTIRLSYYNKRRDHWLAVWAQDLKKEESRYLYVRYVVNFMEGIDPGLDMHQTDDKLKARMEELGLEKIDESYDYLLAMQMRSMTVKKLEELKHNMAKIKANLKELKKKTGRDLWREDLVEFRKAYKVFLTTRTEE